MNYLERHAKTQLEDLIAEQVKVIEEAQTEKARLENLLAKVAD